MWCTRNTYKYSKCRGLLGIICYHFNVFLFLNQFFPINTYEEYFVIINISKISTSIFNFELCLLKMFDHSLSKCCWKDNLQMRMRFCVVFLEINLYISFILNISLQIIIKKIISRNVYRLFFKIKTSLISNKLLCIYILLNISIRIILSAQSKNLFK